MTVLLDNLVLGTKLQDEDTSSIRGQLVYYTDNGDWTLSADHMKDDRNRYWVEHL